MNELLAVLAYIAAFLFILGGCTLGAAAGHMSSTRQRQFPLGWCVLAALLPAAVAFGLPWMFNRDLRVGVLGILWVMAGVVSAYAGQWVAHRAEKRCQEPFWDLKSIKHSP